MEERHPDFEIHESPGEVPIALFRSQLVITSYILEIPRV